MGYCENNKFVLTHSEKVTKLTLGTGWEQIVPQLVLGWSWKPVMGESPLRVQIPPLPLKVVVLGRVTKAVLKT